MDRIRAKIRELLDLVAAQEGCSIGIVLAEEDEDGDSFYSFYIKGYPEDIAVGSDGLSAVAEGEQRKLNRLMETSNLALEDLDDYDEDEDEEDDEDDLEDEDAEGDPPRRGVN